MDVCSWYSVEEKDLVGTNAKGALFKVVIKGWTSQHPNGSYGRKTRRTGGKAVVSYVFCSKSEPSVITGAENRWSALILAPYVSLGATEGETRLYFVVCHGVIADGGDFSPVARRFGYPIKDNDDVPDGVDLVRPEDMLKR